MKIKAMELRGLRRAYTAMSGTRVEQDLHCLLAGTKRMRNLDASLPSSSLFIQKKQALVFFIKSYVAVNILRASPLKTKN